MLDRKTVRIGLASDWHIGITYAVAIKEAAKKMVATAPDLIVMAGDACGGTVGWQGVRWEVEMLRKTAGDDVRIVYCLGNHDWWCRPKTNQPATLRNYVTNIEKIRGDFKKYNIHSIDFDGPCFFKDIAIVGASGWYTTPNPGTNDKNFLPKDLQSLQMLKDTEVRLTANLQILDEVLVGQKIAGVSTIKKVVFASHFPVIDIGAGDWKGNFADFSWSTSIGDLMRKRYDCQHFLCGHSHSRIEGVDGRYECGSDYYRPNYLIIEV